MTERAFCSSRNDKVCGFGGAETANLSNARHRRCHQASRHCKEKQFGLLCPGTERASAYRATYAIGP